MDFLYPRNQAFFLFLSKKHLKILTVKPVLPSGMKNRKKSLWVTSRTVSHHSVYHHLVPGIKIWCLCAFKLSELH